MKLKVKEIILRGVELDIDPDDIYNLPVSINPDIAKHWLLLEKGGVMITNEDDEQQQDDEESNQAPTIKGFNGED